MCHQETTRPRSCFPGTRVSSALALPLLDLNAVDLTRLPKGILDPKMASQYQLMVLGKRGNRLFIGAADPTDQEAAERIKFATQLSPEWVIVEYDKLLRILEAQGASVNEAMESLAGGDFEFDITDEDSTSAESAEISAEVEDAPSPAVCKDGPGPGRNPQVPSHRLRLPGTLHPPA